jgi:nicotinate-nucleotide adenylyltransferase
MIGILGGTFDPPHWGHLKLAANFVEHLGLNELIWIPAGQPWQKSNGITPSKIRFNLTQAIAADLEDYLKTKSLELKSSVSRIELDRHGPSYTIDTAKALRAHYGPSQPLIWLMGVDSFKNMATWQQWEELPNYLHLAIANRSSSPSSSEILDNNSHGMNPIVLKSFQDRIVSDSAELGKSPAGLIFFDKKFHVNVSSTELREKLLLGLTDHEMQNTIPPRVLEMIFSLGLYSQKSAL